MIIKTSNNTLLNRLNWPSNETWGLLERVSLVPGLWPTSLPGEEGHVYFPEDGLIVLSAPGATHHRVRLAMLGRQSCWMPHYWSQSAMQAHVLVAGHAQRIPWAVLQSKGPWLIQTAAASHQLIRQMAQITFCAQHHSATQRLASWLLIAWDQSGATGLQLPLADLMGWMRLPESDLNQAVAQLVTHNAVALEGALGVQSVRALSSDHLATWACSCHLRAKDSATLMPSTPADKMPPA